MSKITHEITKLPEEFAGPSTHKLKQQKITFVSSGYYLASNSASSISSIVNSYQEEEEILSKSSSFYGYLVLKSYARELALYSNLVRDACRCI